MQSQANIQASPWFRIERGSSGVVIYLIGSWRLASVSEIFPAFERALSVSPNDKIIIDASELDEIDTSGVMLVRHVLLERGIERSQVEERHARKEHATIANLVRDNLRNPNPIESPPRLSIIERAGFGTIEFFKKAAALLAFIGKTSDEAIRDIFNPRRIRFREFFVQLERVCVDAIPIVALVTLLIGVVIAYLFALQSEKYGANIFIVDATTLAMCRELSPIIVAIIVAGRSGSAFTAQLGAMKLNDEIDALEALGLSPMQVLVIPRILGLVVAMPLLVFVGDVVGIFGAMLVADIRLDITMTTFIDRLSVVLPTRSFLVGLIKAPVFAAFIAVIGCRMGLTIERNAKSLGLSTTSTVVQSIVSVILLNAAFAVIFVELGI